MLQARRRLNGNVFSVCRILHTELRHPNGVKQDFLHLRWLLWILCYDRGVASYISSATVQLTIQHDDNVLLQLVPSLKMVLRPNTLFSLRLSEHIRTAQLKGNNK